MDFAHFWTAYEEMVKKARGGKLTVEDFQGTSISLTNPGTIGTVHSVPRLMQGQGTIIGVGALEYPAEWLGASLETLNRNAVSKILTLTSTYDHRIIQGAQSGDFLRIGPLAPARRARLLRRDLREPAHPLRADPLGADVDTSHDDDINKVARVQELIHAYRVRGHLMADTDPLEYKQRRAPGPRRHQPRPDPVGPRPHLRHRRVRRPAVPQAAQDPRHPARLVLPHHRRRVHAHPGPRAARVDPVQDRGRLRQDHPRGAAAHRAPAQRRRGVRDLPADQVRRPEALLARGRRVGDRRCSTASCRAPPRTSSTRCASAWRTAAGSTCSPTSRASPTARSSASSRASRTPARCRAPAT